MQGMPHQEALEEDAGGVNGQLLDLEHDADLQDEVQAFGAKVALRGEGEAVSYGGGVGDFCFGEEPLGFCFCEDRRGWFGGGLEKRVGDGCCGCGGHYGRLRGS